MEGSKPPPMHADARALVDALSLVPHPEGGHFRETFRSAHAVTGTTGAQRAASTAIYYLLPAGSFSAWHRVSSDEVWHHYDGDPLELFLLTDAGALSQVTLGRPSEGDGVLPQHVVPAGVWQACRPRGARFSLMGCTVAPGFDFADFEMPTRAHLLERFPAHADLVAALTRA